MSEQLPLSSLPPISRKATLYRNQNLAAARIILESPERYAGLMLNWAQRIVDDEEIHQAAERRLQARENLARTEGL